MNMHSNSRFSTEITPQPAAPIESSEQSDEHEHVLEKDDSEAPRRSKRKRIANLLVMISLCTLWTILPCLLQRRMHLQMQMIGKKQSKVRWTQFFLMGHGSSLNDPMVARQCVTPKIQIEFVFK